MAKSLTAAVSGSLTWSHANTITAGYDVTDQSSDSFSLSITNGTGSGSTADLKYTQLYTLTSSGTQSIDLAGSLTDEYGATITFARIKVMMIRVLSSTEDAASLGGPVDVGGAASNQFVNWIDTAAAKVRVGGTAASKGLLLLAADGATGYAVTAGTGDTLKLTNTSGSQSVKVRVTFIGSSA